MRRSDGQLQRLHRPQSNVSLDCRGLSYSRRVGWWSNGVAGIAVNGIPLDSFENSVLLSILGECALALENIKNAKEKEEAAVLAQNE